MGRNEMSMSVCDILMYKLQYPHHKNIDTQTMTSHSQILISCNFVVIS